MPQAATIDDRERVAALDRYDVLLQPPRTDLLAIVELAALVCRTPLATVNLITDVEQHQVATHGFDAAICRREDSMCASVLTDATPIVVEDASKDARFRSNPFVTGEIGSVRFYASHKLTTPAGVDIGTLCVFDTEPRVLDQAQVEALQTLADRIVDVLELSLRSRELAASNERLSRFAGQVSHDLKTPLTSISLALEMLQDDLGSGEHELDASLLDRAVTGSRRMAAMIEEVLAYSSLGGEMPFAPVDLDLLLRDVVTDLGGPLSGASMSLATLPTVRGNEVQLRAMLQNLLDNASKYRSPDRPLHLEVSVEDLESRWRIDIADNGRGIPVEERRRVLDHRVRLDTDERGHGLGLDTCRRIVTAHGGSIEIMGSAWGGTTVRVELPVA